MWQYISSFVGASSSKFFRWKEIVNDMQLLRQSDASKTCGFKSLFKEWDKMIMSDTYANVFHGGKYKLVELQGKSIKGTRYKKTFEYDLFGVVETEVMKPIETVLVPVEEDQLYRGLFPPEYEPCRKLKKVDVSEDIQLEIGNVEGTKLGTKAFVQSLFQFAEYLFERVKFQMEVAKIEGHAMPSFKF